MALASYKEVKVWQLSMDLAQDIYRLTRAFPKQGQFALTSQLQRAAVSIPSNIAEGHARSGTREYLRFIAMARGSLAEAETQLMIAERLRYVPLVAVDDLVRTDLIGKMLRRLTQALERKIHRNAP